LEELLAELPEDVMRSVVARVEERSYDDIAAELRCSQAVARQRVHRGLGRLRARIGRALMSAFDVLEMQLREAAERSGASVAAAGVAWRPRWRCAKS
jgi:hypothetical protein